MIIICHRIYENGNPNPVLEHRFFGDTLEKAMKVYKAHRKNDSFLRDCDDKGEWSAPSGRPHVFCRARIRIITSDAPNNPITVKG
jgi:hypothetical protein